MAIDAQGVVHFRGAIAQGIAGSDNFAQLSGALRPDKDVFLAASLVNSNPGRVYIETNGEMHAQPVGSNSNAQLFTSLDGVTFDAGD